MSGFVLKLGFAALWALLFYFILFDTTTRELLYAFCERNPLWAPAILIAVQLTLATFALPCSPLTVLAGFLWGPLLGLFYSVLATISASFWTFILGRHFLKSWLAETLSGGWPRKIASLIDRHQWKASIIAHANPVFPGSSLGYLFGLSDISLKVFLIGAFLGTLPLQAVATSMGGLLALWR